MRSPLALLALALAGAAWAGPARAATYYVSPGGSDANAGTSTSAPWQSVARVDAASLAPGDVVRFAGGASYPGLLQPRGSGAAGAPITFTSYGSGSPNLTGGIALASQSWLTFDGLRVDTGAWSTSGTTRGITTSSSGAGVTDLVVRNCTFANVAMGLLIQNRNDARWTVTDSTIQYTRDSGILIYDPNAPNELGGGPMTFAHDQILDTGLDGSITWYKHGVYDIGHDIVWRDDTIRRFADGGISLRARGNTLEGNTIADGPYAIYYSPYDTTPGTTTIAYNKLSNVSAAGIEIAASAVSTDVESFLIADNTIVATGSAAGIRLLGTNGSVKVANNVVTVQDGPAFRADSRPAGGISERADDWFRAGGTPTWGWLGGVYSSLAAYQAASGLGAGDGVADPLLASDLSLGSGSPAVDRGVTDVDPSLTYVGDCSGARYHYCGAGVDEGAVESGAAASSSPSPLGPPSALSVAGVAGDSVSLTWAPSLDVRTTQYRISVDGVAVGTAPLAAYTATGLACGRQYTFAVVALDATGAASTPISASAATAACPVAASGYPATVLADGPQAYWRLGEAGGTSMHDAAGSYAGTYVNAPALGRAGIVSDDTAVGFDGVGQYAQVPFAAGLNTPTFTVEAWARVTGGAGAYRAVVSSRDPVSAGGDGYILYAGSNDRWQFWLGPGSTGWTVLTGPPVVAGHWTHLVGTYDGSTARLYVDGALAASRATAYVVNGRQPLRIGAGATGAPQFYFPGSIDEVAVYAKPLDAARVAAHEAAPSPAPQIATSRSLARSNAGGHVSSSSSRSRRSAVRRPTSRASSRPSRRATTSPSRRGARGR